MSAVVRFTGVVKFFSDEKGYGFITPDIPNPDGSDVFVHKSNLPQELILRDGQKVSYAVVSSEKRKGDGKKATDVQIEF